MMNSRLFLLAVGLTLWARPAAAEGNLSFAWDLSVAPESGISDGGCRAGPEAAGRSGCPNALNPGRERSREFQSSLDQLLLLADRYKSLNLDSGEQRATQLKFTLGLVNVYEQEAQARLALKFRF